MQKQTSAGGVLIKNTGIISIGKLCTQFMSFLLLPLFTSRLSTADYGTVDLISTLINLLLPVVFFQIDEALFRFMVDCRKTDRPFNECFSTAFTFTVWQCVIATLLCLIAIPLVRLEMISFLPINLCIMAFSALMLGACRGIGNNKAYAFGSFLSSAVNISLGLILVGFLNWGMLGMLIAMGAGNAVCALYIFIHLKLFNMLTFRKASKAQFKAMLGYSLPLVPNAVCWWAFTASDRLIVSPILGVGASGILGIAYKLTSVPNMLLNMFILAWKESAALHIDDADKDSFFKKVIGQGVASFSSIILLLLAAIPFLFPIMIDPSYQDAYALIPILLCASSLDIIVGLYSVVYSAVKNTKPVAIASFLAAVINIAVHLALIPFIGLYAAAISSAAAYFVITIIRYFDVKKYVNAPLSKKTIFTYISAFAIITLTYFSNSVIPQAGAFLLALAYAWFMNRGLIRQIYGMIFHRSLKTEDKQR